VDDIVSAPAREPQRSEPALPDGWSWKPLGEVHPHELGGAAIVALAIGPGDYYGAELWSDGDVVISDDEGDCAKVPAAVLRALLREPAPAVARALKLLRYNDWQPLHERVAAAIAALSGDTGGTTP
jgi:hypothetical protein